MPPVDSHTPVFEVCVDDPAGLADAIAGGADRIELCAALALGGLTPAPGLIEQAAETDIPIFAMIRPRPGGFLYSADELDAARRDIRAVRQAGLTGIVFGATDTTGRLDGDAIQRLRDAAGDLPMVLHRAFDVTPDPAEALETAIDLGFVRILTSGGAATAPEGVDALAALVRQAAGRITIMAGGGVDAASVAPLLAAGVHDLHGSCSEVLSDTGPVGRLRIAPTRAQTSVTKVRDMRRAIDAATMEQPA